MEKNKVKAADPVKPYDDSVWERWSMYDNIPYNWDPDLNDTKKLTMVSGNLIKAYRCLIKEPYEVKN